MMYSSIQYICYDLKDIVVNHNFNVIEIVINTMLTYKEKI